MPFKIAALILCLFPITLAAQSTGPVASGYITSVDSDGSFAVEGTPVRPDSKTEYNERDDNSATKSNASFHPFVGEFVEVFGPAPKRKSGMPILATRVTELPPVLGDVHGTAIIDFVPPSEPSVPDHIVRADGFILRIPATASVKFEEPLTPQTGFATNIWINYRGVLQKDGTILVSTAALRKNTVKSYEDKLHKKKEYDPAAVSPDANQSGVSKFFLGLDVKRFPPHPDADLQARIGRIGNTLVPAFQRALPSNEPTRLDFRFQVVDVKEFNEPLALANGIVLVPYIGLDRLKTDSQIATPIAIAIAVALEKEQVRGRPARNTLTGTALAGDIAGFFIPFAGLPGDIATGIAQKHLIDLQMEQAGRVALCLMHDAGYEIQSAPLAMWLSTPKDPKPIEKIKLPARAAYLFKTLGTIWQTGSPANQLTPTKPVASAQSTN